MLSKDDNALATDITKGKPMGELFRRFWLPFLLSSDLPGPDGIPERVKLLGEELIAFRDTNGRVGLMDAYCPHRGAPMFFGRNEEEPTCRTPLRARPSARRSRSSPTPASTRAA
jgi:hypothetical protein